MEYRIIGKSELRISRLGLGGIALQRISAAEAVSLLSAAYDSGINFIDTARGYTVSEELIGRGLQSRRSAFILASKSMQRTKEGILGDIRISLKNLRTDYLDLYQLHNIRNEAEWERVSAPDGALAGLLEARQAGLIRQIGISSHSSDMLARILSTQGFTTMMFPYNVVENGNKQLFADAAQQGTGTLAMKPLAGGFISEPGRALRYLAGDGNVDCILVGMASPAEITANVQALQDGPLAPGEIEELENWAKEAGQEFCRRCGYCLPCPQGIDIPMVFLLEGYYDRYDLQDWARDRYAALPVPGTSCQTCGQCGEKCPYGLPIPAKLARAAGKLG